MVLELPFVTLDVFTKDPYKGNPLAIVTIPKGTSPKPTQEQKQLIAREFNLSETVIVHEEHEDNADPATRHIDIFITDAEIPFAGHPTIGTAVSLLPQGITTLVTKAGPITLAQPQPGVVKAGIPHNTRLHARRLADLGEASFVPGDLSSVPAIRAAELSSPLFSIVNGMTFALVQLPSLELLSQVALSPAVFPADKVLDEGWQNGLICRYYYVRLGVNAAGVEQIRSRMVMQSIEDPATGSAACALSSYLTLQADGAPADRTVNYEIVQGVEMGRQSDIFVEVVTKDAKIDKVSLAGTATQVMRGYITI